MQFVELENELASLKFLTQKDFEKLYAVASNPEIWAQHPDSSRYTSKGFSTYFDKLMATDCPFLIKDRRSNDVIGASSFYEYDIKQKSVAIGYTFWILRIGVEYTMDRSKKLCWAMPSNLLIKSYFMFVIKTSVPNRH